MRLSNPIAKQTRTALLTLRVTLCALLLTLHGPRLLPAAAVLQAPVEESQQAQGSGEFASPEQSTALWTGSRAAGATIFILALILTTMALLKRYMPHRFGPLGHRRRIHVLETVPIGDKRSLVLVQIDGRGLLLATTPSSVSLLREVQADPHPSSAPEAEPKGGKGPGFKEALAAEMAGTVPGQASPLERISLIREELEAR
jgi:flagellar biosynthetic protein FliO